MPEVAASIMGRELMTGGTAAVAALDLAAATNPLSNIGISTDDPQPAASVAVAANPFFVAVGRD
jgi:hypothetical protein